MIYTASFSKWLCVKCLRIFSGILPRIHTRLGSREASKESGAKNLESALVPSTKDLRSDFWNLGTAFNNIDQRNCFLQPAMCLKVYVQLLNTLLTGGCMHTQLLQLCPNPLCNPMGWARQAPLSIVFSRQEYWRGLPCPPPGDLPWSGFEPNLLHLLHCGGLFSAEPPGAAIGSFKSHHTPTGRY